MKCPHCSGNIDVKFVKAPPDSGGQAHAGGQPSSTEGTGDLGELLAAINDDELEGQSVKFVADVRARYAQYKDRTRMSEKQMAWIRKLASGDTEEAW